MPCGAEKKKIAMLQEYVYVVAVCIFYHEWNFSIGGIAHASLGFFYILAPIKYQTGYQ
jgi:hypothetical protein